MLVAACIALAFVICAVAWFGRSAFRPPQGYRKFIAEKVYGPRAEPESFHRSIVFELDFQGKRYSGHSDNAVDRAILYYGAYEKELLHLLGDIMDTLPPERRVFYDIGANTGQHTLFMADKARRIHAFEPYPPVLARLRKHVEGNGLTNVTIHAVGLSDQDGDFPFFEPPRDNLGAGSFMSGYKPRNSNNGLQLHLALADRLIAENKLEPPGIIKIDTEGFETAVLRGLRSTLAEHSPIVLMEVTIDPRLPHLNRSLEAITADLPDGYQFYSVTSKDPFVGDYRLTKFNPDFAQYGQYALLCFAKADEPLIPKKSQRMAHSSSP